MNFRGYHCIILNPLPSPVMTQASFNERSFRVFRSMNIDCFFGGLWLGRRHWSGSRQSRRERGPIITVTVTAHSLSRQSRREGRALGPRRPACLRGGKRVETAAAGPAPAPPPRGRGRRCPPHRGAAEAPEATPVHENREEDGFVVIRIQIAFNFRLDYRYGGDGGGRGGICSHCGGE